MKRWNSIWFLFFLLLVGCEDNNKMQNTQSKFTLVGVDADKIDMQLYSPELKINFVNETAGDFPTTGYSGDLSIDLDSDSNDDIKFHAHYGYGCSMAGYFRPTKACEVKSIDNKEIEIYSNPLSLNDTIDNNLHWKIMGPKKDGEQMIISTVLSSFTPEWTNNEEIRNNVWINENLYLAIRVKKGNIFKFGWIRFHIDDYYDIKINEIGFEK